MVDAQDSNPDKDLHATLLHVSSHHSRPARQQNLQVAKAKIWPLRMSPLHEVRIDRQAVSKFTWCNAIRAGIMAAVSSLWYKSLQFSNACQ